jgi:predicted secreted protein
MSRALLIAAILAAAGTTSRAQQAPTASPSQVQVIPEMEISGDEKPIVETNSDTSSPRLREEVNLADTPDSFDIPIPADAPPPDKAPEVTGALPGDEPARNRPPVTGTVDVTAKNNGQIVPAKVGDLIRIRLEANPSTGYSWELRDFEFGVAEFFNADLAPRDGGNMMFGAPGDAVITLQAVKPGQQKIQLVYRRIWEPPDQVAATFGFELDVAGDAPAPEAATATPPTPPPTPAP